MLGADHTRITRSYPPAPHHHTTTHPCTPSPVLITLQHTETIFQVSLLLQPFLLKSGVPIKKR